VNEFLNIGALINSSAVGRSMAQPEFEFAQEYGVRKFYAPREWSSVAGMFSVAGSSERLTVRKAGAKTPSGPEEKVTRKRARVIKVVTADLEDSYGRYRLEIGGFDPFRGGTPLESASVALENPVLDVELLHLLGVLMYLCQVSPGERPQPRNIAWAEAVRIFAGNCADGNAPGSYDRAKMKKLFLRLTNVRWAIGRPSGGGQTIWGKSERIFTHDAITPKTVARMVKGRTKRTVFNTLDGLLFNERFIEALLPSWDVEKEKGKAERQLQEISLDGLACGRSPLGKLFFLYFPKLAVGSNGRPPFEIGVTKLCEQLGVPMKAGHARRVFLGHKLDGTSGILHDFDGAPLLRGVLRLGAREGKNDLLALGWADGYRRVSDKEMADKSLLRAFTKLSADEFAKLTRPLPALSMHEKALLGAAEIGSPTSGFRVEILEARALMGRENFESFLVDMDAARYRREGGAYTEGPEARLRHYMRKRVGELFGSAGR